MNRKVNGLGLIHFRNHRTDRTLCGHSYKMPERKITNNMKHVTCKACLRSIKDRKWVQEMINKDKK